MGGIASGLAGGTNCDSLFNRITSVRFALHRQSTSKFHFINFYEYKPKFCFATCFRAVYNQDQETGK